MTKTELKRAKVWLSKYLRYTDYIGAASLYLKDNCLLERELEASDFKMRVLGHWGTVPGLNFIYAQMNYLVSKHKAKMLFVTGPGHGAPSILANSFLEGTLKEFYKDYSVDGKGVTKLIHDFSWPHTPFPSHVTPSVPGSILEGGELGYSLATAFGAVLDNPDLIAVAVVGDGEAETGPIATAWHSNKFLNPATSGAVLPIIHINGYKISNPTIFGTMSDTELRDLFKGYGYEPLIVDGSNLDEKMFLASEKAYQMIREIQLKARKKGEVLQPKWPVILLRTPKGWKGVHDFHGKPVEDSFRSHGVPIDHPDKNADAREAVKKWLLSYQVSELMDKKGRPNKDVLEFVPKGRLRIGMCENAIGGNLYKKLSLPSLGKYEVKVKNRGEMKASSMKVGALMLRDVIGGNKKNFRFLCPDELESNLLGAMFEKTKRAYMWPLRENDENLAPDGRAMEMLSEHTLQGWYQGYLLTGRHGMLASYEAFLTIITSMVDQYAKFLKQSFKIKWRKPVAAAIYLLTSVGWRQDHNGYSHQNPSFVSNVLQKHGKFCQIYYPPDANSLLVAFEETMKKKDAICAIVAGKRDLPQWLSLKEARAQAKTGLGIWEWATGKEAAKNPDVVLASAGDYMTQEAMLAIDLCRELLPEMKIRYVNVSELTALGLGDYCSGGQMCLTQTGIDHYFTKDRSVVFSYHGYVNDIEQILWGHADPKRFKIHGYKEEGSTTTPFDMMVVNEVSRYHLASSMVEEAAKFNKSVAGKKKKILKMIEKRLNEHRAYIEKFGVDMDHGKRIE